MKKVTMIFALLLACVFAFQDVQADPQIEFESTTIDYGEIDNGADGKRLFKFTNTGDAPLLITKCNGSCGCTVPVCPQEAIMPGDDGQIEVKYDTKRTGSFTKTVTVQSNAEGGTQVLKITGTVRAPQPGE